MKRLILLLFLALLTCDNRTNEADVAQLIYEFIETTNTGHSLRKTYCIMEYSAMYDIDPEILMRLGQAESSFRHWLVNDYSGCLGIYQISPKWWGHIGYYACNKKYAKYLKAHQGTNQNKVLKFIGVNTQAACIILRTYLDMYDGDYRQALTKYAGFTGKHAHKIEKRDEYLRKVLGK